MIKQFIPKAIVFLSEFNYPIQFDLIVKFIVKLYLLIALQY